MNNNILIAKQDVKVPDYYEMTVYYIDGKKEKFDVAHHFPVKENILDFVTKEDIWSWVPLSNVKRIEFDKNFSILVHLESERLAKKEQNDSNKQDSGTNS